jgi:hypothetical protein
MFNVYYEHNKHTYLGLYDLKVYIIVNIFYQYYQHICKGFNVNFSLFVKSKLKA